ncbi:hypothetical protein AAC387_Pa05g0243 [Persea americana]
MGRRRGSRDPVNRLFGWVQRQSMKVKTFLAVASVLCSFVALKSFGSRPQSLLCGIRSHSCCGYHGPHLQANQAEHLLRMLML